MLSKEKKEKTCPYYHTNKQPSIYIWLLKLVLVLVMVNNSPPYLQAAKMLGAGQSLWTNSPVFQWKNKVMVPLWHHFVLAKVLFPLILHLLLPWLILIVDPAHTWFRISEFNCQLSFPSFSKCFQRGSSR